MGEATDIRSRIRKLRKKTGLNINAAAAKAGVSANTWISLETHGVVPKSEGARQRIAQFLGVEAEELFGSPDSEE